MVFYTGYVPFLFKCRKTLTRYSKNKFIVCYINLFTYFTSKFGFALFGTIKSVNAWNFHGTSLQLLLFSALLFFTDSVFQKLFLGKFFYAIRFYLNYHLLNISKASINSKKYPLFDRTRDSFKKFYSMT